MTKEEIDNRIKEIEPKTKKWKYIVGTAGAGVLITVGIIFGVGSLISHTRDMLLYLCLPILGAGLLYLIIELPFLLSAVKYQKELDDLLSQRKELEVTQKNDDSEELLLRLLSEGKITIEEYKQLSNKEIE